MHLIDKISTKVRKHYKEYVLKSIMENKALELNKAIVVNADPRGGSTWIAGLLNTIPFSVIANEPITPKTDPEITELNFSMRQYIPENED